MKKLMMLIAVSFALTTAVNAQTQKGWYLIGGDISNINLGLQKDATSFSFAVTPKVAWFVKDNLAVGAQVGLGFQTVKDSYTNFSYNISPLARYYFKGNALDAVSKTRWFAEGNIGIAGQNFKPKNGSSSNTNGLGIGIGPGIAYFINQNIALEALAKYNYLAGFGNVANSSNINIGVGMQIYLPKAKVKELKQDVR